MFLKDLGNRIRAQREKHGLKQQDVANALDISPQAVSKWERGENAPDVTTLGPLARLLGTSVDWILAVNKEPQDTFEAAVTVSSIRGAHKKSLSMKPREFALWANGIFYQLTELTLNATGIPVKYMGDQFLSFFSGPRHAERALETALRAQQVIAEDLKMGLSRGEVFLGLVGHPEYARPDIMGETVNIAFLTQEWADANARLGLAATAEFVESCPADWLAETKVRFGKPRRVQFKGVAKTVLLREIVKYSES